jgi:hypothetical protein
LRRLWLGFTFAAALTGCAKFPAQGLDNQFTRIIFRMELADNINTAFDDRPGTYIYNVAIRATDDVSPEPQRAPIPVVAANNPNGRMDGSPTHFVELNTQDPLSSEPYLLFRFATQQEIPNPNEPDNPINLAVFSPSTRGRILNFIRPSDSPRIVQFELFVNLLAQSDEAARQLQKLQVNFLTMNRLANQGAGTRFIDSLGDNRTAQGLTQYIEVDLRRNSFYSNQTTGELEPTGDTPDPSLDIVNWSIEVQRP